MPPTLTYPWWTPWPGTGPAAELLGDITELRIVELGCGSGENAAAFAAAGAVVTGIDANPAKIAQALQRWSSRPGLGFVHADATTYLANLHKLPDVVVSIFGALSFSPAPPLLDLISTRLAPHGRLALSARLPPAGHHSPEDWTALLKTHRFEINRCLVLLQPDDPYAPGCCVLVAGTLGSVGAVDYLTHNLTDFHARVGLNRFSMAASIGHDGEADIMSEPICLPTSIPDDDHHRRTIRRRPTLSGPHLPHPQLRHRPRRRLPSRPDDSRWPMDRGSAG